MNTFLVFVIVFVIREAKVQKNVQKNKAKEEKLEIYSYYYLLGHGNVRAVRLDKLYGNHYPAFWQTSQKKASATQRLRRLPFNQFAMKNND
jgi:hypothetical protein